MRLFIGIPLAAEVAEELTALTERLKFFVTVRTDAGPLMTALMMMMLILDSGL